MCMNAEQVFPLLSKCINAEQEEYCRRGGCDIQLGISQTSTALSQTFPMVRQPKVGRNRVKMALRLESHIASGPTYIYTPALHIHVRMSISKARVSAVSTGRVRASVLEANALAKASL